MVRADGPAPAAPPLANPCRTRLNRSPDDVGLDPLADTRARAGWLRRRRKLTTNHIAPPIRATCRSRPRMEAKPVRPPNRPLPERSPNKPAPSSPPISIPPNPPKREGAAAVVAGRLAPCAALGAPGWVI